MYGTIEDKLKVCFSHIDIQIMNYIKDGKDVNSIKKELQNKILKFQNILSDLKEGEPRYYFLMAHNYVCEKRIGDLELIETLQFEYIEYSKYDIKKMFNLIKLRDKILDISHSY